MSPPRLDARCALFLDVDGTLVDSNYHHTLAWSRAFRSAGYDVPLWRIHRSIGMGGERLVPRLIGETADQQVGEQVRDRWEKEVEPLLAARSALTARRAEIEV